MKEIDADANEANMAALEEEAHFRALGSSSQEFADLGAKLAKVREVLEKLEGYFDFTKKEAFALELIRKALKEIGPDAGQKGRDNRPSQGERNE